jgi:hypothetical protein
MDSRLFNAPVCCVAGFQLTTNNFGKQYLNKTILFEKKQREKNKMESTKNFTQKTKFNGSELG